MKAIFVLLLCGLTYVLGEFDCKQDYPEECIDASIKNFGDLYPETESDLEYYCKTSVKEVSCNLDFAIQCPKTLTGATRHVLEDFLAASKRICNKKDPLHQKFLEKIPCLNQKKKSVEKACEDEIKEQDYCTRTVKVMQCTENELLYKCGQDAQELVNELFKQHYSMKDVFCT